MNEFVLSGVTRQVILDLAKAKKVSFKEITLTANDVYEADEVFISSTGIEILPVCTVNQRPIGNGKPGPITKYLHKVFLKYFEE